MDRITWVDIGNGVSVGSLGYRRIFTAYAIYKKGVPSHFELDHELPFRQVRRNFPSKDAAQQFAGEYLVRAMSILGFVPKEGSDA